MFCEECQAAVAIGIAVNTRPGWRATHSKTCMPPIDPPATLNHRSIARWSINRTLASTMAAMVMTGNSQPQGRPVLGLRLDGPVDPMQPPRMLGQITKKRSVSIGLPGPTIASHQPGLRVIGCSLATY